MLSDPQPGEQFLVPNRPGLMTVEVCHLGVSESDGSIRYLVRAPDGSRWLLTPRVTDDDAARWLGVPLARAELA